MKTSSKWFPPLRRVFPPEAPTPTQARTQEKNKGRQESRSIRTQSVGAEEMCFPFACQAARLLRQTTGRQDEEVTLITSASPEKLPALRWLQLNRQYWGIEAMHQCLDVSHNDDRCRIQSSRGLWLMGMFRRLSHSLFMEWRIHQPAPHPHFLTTTDFHSAMSEEHRSRALRLVLAQRPTWNPPS
jgi:hypothetical protein